MNLQILTETENRIREDFVPSDGTRFSGARLLVTDKPAPPVREGTVVVLSPLAGEISWVVYQMKAAFTDEIDYLNKLYFYPEMGRAAAGAIAAGATRPEVLLAVVNAARDFWSNRPLSVKSGIFEALEAEGNRTYFAYGSNLSHKQMAERCPASEFVCPGVLRGYRFVINARGVATIVPDPESKVYGGIYEVTNSCVRTLDRREGVDEGIYKQATVRVKSILGDTVNCLTYLASCSDPGVPRENYLEKILQGAADCELPSAYIEFLKTFAVGG